MRKFNLILKKTLICTLLLFFVNGALMAQNDENSMDGGSPTADRTFHLIYIAQGSQEEMPVELLKRNLESAWGGITGGPVIFYLSRGTEEPIIVQANCHEDSDIDKERQTFEEQILSRLQEAIQYSVDGSYDKKRLLELLVSDNENGLGLDIVDNAGKPLYKDTFFEFHVGQDFWDSGNNETILASLFFELNVSSYINAGHNFHFNVFCPRRLTVDDETSVFGLLNPDDCMKYINLERIY